MSGFEKIDLAPKQARMDQKGNQSVSDVSMKRTKRKMNPRLSSRSKAIIVGVVLLFILFTIFFLVLPAKRTYIAGIATYRQARAAASAMKNENVELASQELATTTTDLVETQKNLHRMAYLHFVPIAAWYYNDADHMMKAGSSGLQAATLVVNSLKPYADVLGLKGQGSFTTGSAEDRIKTAVLTMGKITPRIDDIATYMQTVKSEMDKVNPKHYPSLIFGKKVQTQLTSIQGLTDNGVTFVNEARPLIKVLPSLLGEETAKKYLVLFQNDKELRPTGGFITAYAIFSVDKGVIHADSSNDIYTLDDSISNHPTAPAPILKYLPKVYNLNIRDSNLSPDYITSMDAFKALYAQSSIKQPVDGIIAIDTSVLVSTIKVLDDSVTAGGINFTTKIDARCDCPQAIYELEDNISRPVNYIKTDRKGLLGQLLSAILSKALSSSPKLYWGPLFQSFIAQTNQKHVLFNLYDQNAQSGIESLNAAGRIRPFAGDYIHINDSNFGGDKANLFVTEDVENKYDIQSDGSIQKTVTITYNNPKPPSDCNLESGGLCLNSSIRDWLRIYVPKGSQLVNVTGSEVKVTTYDELGKTVFDGFLTIRPLAKAKYTITYKLPFKLSHGSPLPLMIQKQPGTSGNTYTNKIGDHSFDPFPLYSDTETKLNF